jgi:hypothetical protein
MSGLEKQWQALQEDEDDEDDEHGGLDGQHYAGEQGGLQQGNRANAEGISEVESPNRTHYVHSSYLRHCAALPHPYHMALIHPSPLGLSNYDALDEEDFVDHDEDHYMEEEEEEEEEKDEDEVEELPEEEGVPGPSSRPRIDFKKLTTQDGSVEEDADFIESFGAFGPGPFDFGAHQSTMGISTPSTRHSSDVHRAGPGLSVGVDNEASIPGTHQFESRPHPLVIDTNLKGKEKEETGAGSNSPEEDLVGRLMDMVGESERKRDKEGSLRSK